MSNDHYVPRHYLRGFAIDHSERIMVVDTLYNKVYEKGIGGICCGEDFYGHDDKVNNFLWKCENKISKILEKVINEEKITQRDIVYLSILAITLNMRTRKVFDIINSLPENIALIFREKSKELHDNENVKEPDISKFIFRNFLICFFEMKSLWCKLLRCTKDSFFITSDNPVVKINQYKSTDKLHSNLGFSSLGFQLLLSLLNIDLID